MSWSDEDLLELLVDENDELRELVAQHRKYEDKLDQLAQRRYLSDAEQREAAMLKKLKLKGKDRIHQILAEWRRDQQAETRL